MLVYTQRLCRLLKRARSTFVDRINELPAAEEEDDISQRKVYAARTLLFLNDDSTLKPLAIELSSPHPENEQLGAISTYRTPETSRPTAPRRGKWPKPAPLRMTPARTTSSTPARMTPASGKWSTDTLQRVVSSNEMAIDAHSVDVHDCSCDKAEHACVDGVVRDCDEPAAQRAAPHPQAPEAPLPEHVEHRCHRAPDRRWLR